MRKFCLFFLSLFVCIDVCNAAVRTKNTSPRNDLETVSSRQKTVTKKTNVSRTVATRTPKTQQAIQQDNNISPRKAVSRSASTKTIVARPAKQKKKNNRTNTVPVSRISRAATNTAQIVKFDDNYNSCRDAYFSCMDQFCANQNETYRRCVCSSRLAKIQKQEKKLSQTANQLQDFQSLNIDVISKTSNEVKSMLSASEGESGIKTDISDAATTLNNISDVLQKTKKKALSTQGRLDIAGDIKSIWSTTDLISGTNIADLTGESLYNAVHNQCYDILSQNCATEDLTMIASTYGMYIENDCSLLDSSISSQITTANASIRTTRNEMQNARLENYNAHNSLTTNSCITNVREDIMKPTACGENYVHCLDFTGKYLNATTGEPIYSADFYQLENQISLSGDILRNSQNAQIVNMLNKKRIFAESTLDLCSDNADDVWDEFLRQSIVEIYQGQQQKVQTVKSECLHVVNECYLNKSDSLKEFSDTASEILLGHTLELSEQMCADKLTTCSNLYGGGPEGLEMLVNTMTEITDQTIAQTCPELLTTFAQNICTVSETDSAHSYPYGCRVYAPGESMYAHNALCNSTLTNPFSKSDIILSHADDNSIKNYICKDAHIRYTSCKFNYYLYNETLGDAQLQYYSQNEATECHVCPTGYICNGDQTAPQSIDSDLYKTCGIYYVGSLYQQLVRYALQNCTRPSDDSYVLSESLLADVNIVMQRVQSELVSELSKECDRYNGTWVDLPWTDENYDGLHDSTGDSLLQEFYTATGTNKLWGYCK